MSTDKELIMKESASLELRNTVLTSCQKMEEGPDKDALRELVNRFTDYTQLQTGMIPNPETGTGHENHVAKLKMSSEFFVIMTRVLYSLDLIKKLDPDLSKTGVAVTERIQEDRAKYQRTIKLLIEIYTVHLGGNGALFSLDALPDDIRIPLQQALKNRKLIES